MSVIGSGGSGGTGGPGGAGGAGKPPGIGGTDGPKGPGGPEQTEGASFVDKLAQAEQGGAVGGAGASSGPSGSDPIAALARQVEAGTMTGKQAIDQLMEMTLKNARLPESAKAQLREKLEALVSDSGFVGDKARTFGSDGEP